MAQGPKSLLLLMLMRTFLIASIISATVGGVGCESSESSKDGVNGCVGWVKAVVCEYRKPMDS